MFVSPQELFERSRRGSYAVGAFPAFTAEAAQAILDGAARSRAPVVLQITEEMMRSIGLRALTQVVRTLAAESETPTLLHFDHAQGLELIQAAIEAGCMSVMVDTTSQPFETATRLTREVVTYAHDRGVWVEGALPDEAGRTSAQAARRFVESTGIDGLVVSVGTIHGAFSGQEYVQFELLEAIERELPRIPLILHGASGVSAGHLRQVARTHVVKVVISTELYQAFLRAAQAENGTALEHLTSAQEAMAALVEVKVRLLGEGEGGTLEAV